MASGRKHGPIEKGEMHYGVDDLNVNEVPRGGYLR